MMRPMDRERVRLFLLGFLTLFLELVLIRYLAGNIWNLGYFPNLVLIAAFVGMGLGFVLHTRIDDSRSEALFAGAALLLALLLAVVAIARPGVPGFSRWQAEIAGELYFTATQTEQERTSPLLFLLWFAGVVAIFAAIAQRTAKVFRRFAPLDAYTLDIAGSCAGIVTFMGVSALALPAWSWMLALLAIWLGAAQSKRAVATAALLACAGIAWTRDIRLSAVTVYEGPLHVRWSPYQKLEVALTNDKSWVMIANGIAHQSLRTEESLRGSRYEAPHRTGLSPRKRVLVIGAGTGNDVATALANGAEHVDAVEIDPRIAAFGRELHPLRPYSDPRVVVTIDDGRAFMTRSAGGYDLIVFALTDSVVKVSAVAQLRLENYLFTRESLTRAWELLDEDGALVLVNAYRTEWLAAKIEALVEDATGRDASLLFRDASDDSVMMMVERASPPRAATTSFDLPTDDWPFLYLRERGIPRFYLGAMGFLAALAAVFLFLLSRGGAARVDWRIRGGFALMGAAFLLLETKSIVQFSLLFGTTWRNTSLVFLGILLLVLAANRLATRVDSRHVRLLFGLLLASCAIGWAVPLATLLAIDGVPARFVVASALTFAPIFLANLLFSVHFRDQPAAEEVFGWNLLGATAGGILEYTSMAFGYRSLAIVVGICYALVWVLFVLARRNARVATS